VRVLDRHDRRAAATPTVAAAVDHRMACPPCSPRTAYGVKRELRDQRAAEDVRNWFGLVRGHLIHFFDLYLFISDLYSIDTAAGQGHAGSSPSPDTNPLRMVRCRQTCGRPV
jgi:hypothetical protein